MLPFRRFFSTSQSNKNAEIRALPWQILVYSGIGKYTLEEVVQLRDEILKELLGLPADSDYTATAIALSEIIAHHREKLNAAIEEKKQVAAQQEVVKAPAYVQQRDLQVAAFSGTLPERVSRNTPVSQFRLMSDILYIIQRAHVQRNNLEDRGAADGIVGVHRLRGQPFDDFLEQAYRTIIQFGAAHLDNLKLLEETVALTMDYLKIKDANQSETNLEIKLAHHNKLRRIQEKSDTE